MIAVLKRGTTKQQLDHLLSWLKNMSLDVHVSEGQEFTVLGLIGADTFEEAVDLTIDALDRQLVKLKEKK